MCAKTFDPSNIARYRQSILITAVSGRAMGNWCTEKYSFPARLMMQTQSRKVFFATAAAYH